MADQKGLCSICWQELSIPGKPCCAACQRPFYGPVQSEDDTLCARCLARPPRHSGIAAATLYNDASRRLVLKFKYGRRIAMAPILARAMAARLPELDGDWLAIPVPLHRTRLWARGFNQSALLARELARLTGQSLCVDGLIRCKRTPSLGGLGRKERERIMAGAIIANPARQDRIRNARILLVDDVLTSGATSNACIAALKRAGAKDVLICCFARKLDNAPPPTQK